MWADYPFLLSILCKVTSDWKGSIYDDVSSLCGVCAFGPGFFITSLIDNLAAGFRKSPDSSKLLLFYIS